MSNSRDQILARLAANKPQPAPLPQISLPEAAGPAGGMLPKDDSEANSAALLEQFCTVAVSIGSSVHRVKSYAEVENILKEQFAGAQQVVSRCPEIKGFAEKAPAPGLGPHVLEAVDLAILPGQLGVAENSAIWVAEEQMGQRVLPFICQHLALVLPASTVVPSMHHAYPLLKEQVSGFGVFIAGPSKTADIEQSLVLGAHGPRSLTVFIFQI